MTSYFTALLALMSTPGVECRPDSCGPGQLVEYKGGEVTKGIIGTQASLFFSIAFMTIVFVGGVRVGVKMAPTKIEKESGTQTDKLERMSVSVQELTLEAIKERLRAKDLRMSGLKGELADRLEDHTCW